MDKPTDIERYKDINYHSTSDSIRPKLGYRICPKCKKTLAINGLNFYKNRQSADGFAYICRKCFIKLYKNKK